MSGGAAVGGGGEGGAGVNATEHPGRHVNHLGTGRHRPLHEAERSDPTGVVFTWRAVPGLVELACERPGISPTQARCEHGTGKGISRLHTEGNEGGALLSICQR